jgi:aminoglycoside phosphotransferase family enzyme/predicted kinase
MSDQRDVINYLSQPAAYGLPAGSRIERIDTHISVVWLAGDRAYKLKRAVTYDYVDFSRLESRRNACEAEVRLNRRTAPSLYVGVRAVTRESDGALALDGGGQPIDWLVEMRRFDQDALFDRLAERGDLNIDLMTPLADAIAELHSQAEPRRDCGGSAGMKWVIDGNAGTFEQRLTGDDRVLALRITAAARTELERCGPLLDARRLQGMARWCHGDLHLRNIVLLEGQPTLFDGVEFNDRIACVDVLYDLAFLLMDLWHRRLRAHANAVFNEYLSQSADLAGLRLLPLFLSCRAAIRAKTSATGAALQTVETAAEELRRAAHEYLLLAEAPLVGPGPRLVAIGGFSGSGKSTLARRLAPLIGAIPGALVLRSDVIRKQLHGVSPLTPLEASGYSPEINARVYQTLAERARIALSGGHAVIADAVYRSPEERDAIRAVARDVDAPFLGLWLEAPSAILGSRLIGRTGDPSDATVAVLDRQLESGAGAVEWQPLDTSPSLEKVVERATVLLRETG